MGLINSINKNFIFFLLKSVTPNLVACFVFFRIVTVFYHIFLFFCNIELAILKRSAPVIITSWEVNAVGYDANLNQSERMHLYNHCCNNCNKLLYQSLLITDDIFDGAINNSFLYCICHIISIYCIDAFFC